jgi:CRP/FNR family transcriptional regulator, cyclic AMP receptor protein
MHVCRWSHSTIHMSPIESRTIRRVARIEPGAARRRKPRPDDELRDRAEILRSTDPFSVLDEDGLLRLCAKVTSASFRRGDIILREGERADVCFVVATGHVKLVVHGPTGRRRMIAVVGPNQLFGLLGLVDHGPHVMDAEAIDASLLLGVSAGSFWELVDTRPMFARRVVELIGQRLRRADHAVRDLVFYDATARLARTLLDLAERQGKPLAEGVQIEARITQKELAQMTGMSRASVNKLLASLISRGWIEWNEGKPIVRRPDLLMGQARAHEGRPTA